MLHMDLWISSRLTPGVLKKGWLMKRSQQLLQWRWRTWIWKFMKVVMLDLPILGQANSLKKAKTIDSERII